MNLLGNLMSKVFGQGEYQPSNYEGSAYEERKGFFGEGGLFEKLAPKKQEMLSPIPDRGNYTPRNPEEPYQPSPEQSEYAQTPDQRPQEEVNQFEFPAGDKPPIPEEYHEQLSGIENSNIVASVLAQETGGYGYRVPDPSTGEIVDWDVAKAKNLRGKDGEVGMSQIIPKWYWKDAGFPDEESYARALYDPTFAISEAGRILNKNFAIYGDWKKALGAWNKNPSFPDEILGRIGIQE